MLRRTTAILATAAAVTIATITPAAAQTPELTPYGAGGTASALTLLIGDQEFTFSGTSATVISTPEAAANGQAVLSPLFTSPGAPVTSTGTVANGLDCTNIALPAPINLADADVTCVHTTAAVNNLLPVSSSTSDEIDLDLISAELVGQLVDAAIRPALEQLLAGLAPALEGLAPVLNAPTVPELVSSLLDDLSAGDTLANLQIGVTGSDSERSASALSGESDSTGATVTLLPELATGPLATVVIGASSAKVTVDPATADATPTASVANIDIDLTGLKAIVGELLGNTTGALGQPIAEALALVLGPILDAADTELEGMFNQSVDELACPDSPLAAVLCFSLGGINELDADELAARGLDFGAGTVGIEASVLSLDLLDSTVALGVGRSAAAANAALATPGPLPGSPSEPLTPARARTGGDAPMALTLALLAVATVGATLLRRSRTA